MEMDAGLVTADGVILDAALVVAVVTVVKVLNRPVPHGCAIEHS